MGVLDKFLDAIKLNDEDEEYLDDDILDDDEDFLDDEEEVVEEKPRRRFFEKFGSRKSRAKTVDDYDDELDEIDDYEEEDEDDFEPEPEPVKRHTVSASPQKSASVKSKTPVSQRTMAQPPQRRVSAEREERTSRTATSSKITPMRQSRRSGSQSVEVCVLRPLSMENTREIADTLIAGSTVILNLEGIDVELAQRIIDFASGSCYSLSGSLQKVSSYIFVLGPENVDITGDLQNILGGSIPSVRAGY